jgi:hypothetical protein
MDTLFAMILNILASLGWPVGAETPPRPQSVMCRPDPDDTVVYKDLSRPYADAGYYPAGGCVGGNP